MKIAICLISFLLYKSVLNKISVRSKLGFCHVIFLSYDNIAKYDIYGDHDDMSECRVEVRLYPFHSKNSIYLYIYILIIVCEFE